MSRTVKIALYAVAGVAVALLVSGTIAALVWC